MCALELPRGVLDELKSFGENAERFFSRLAQLSPEEQEKCFVAMVDMLEGMGSGVEHCIERLRQGKALLSC